MVQIVAHAWFLPKHSPKLYHGDVMVHYRCEKCSTIVTAEELPESCEECGASAAEAYPDGPVTDDTGRRPIDGMFDVSGTTKSEPKDQDGLAAVSTMELDEGDLVETEDEDPPAKAAPPAPPPIQVVSTMELDESDLEEQADTTPPPVPVPRFQPRAGRVAYPIPTDRDTENEETERHVEMDEMAAAGLPPAPPTPDQALSTQTRGLDSQPTGKGKTIAVVVGVVCIGVAVTVGLALRGPAQTDRLDGATPDLQPPDLRPPDLAPPDLRPDQPIPDAPIPDTARPQPPRPKVAGTPAPGPRPRPKTRPDAGPIGDPLEEAQRHYREGLRALIRGQLNGAVAKFNMALKRNPHLSMAYRGLGLAYEKSGKGALAKEAFKRYLKMRPNAPDAAAIRKRIEGP
jgi:hypothetical protein